MRASIDDDVAVPGGNGPPNVAPCSYNLECLDGESSAPRLLIVLFGSSPPQISRGVLSCWHEDTAVFQHENLERMPHRKRENGAVYTVDRVGIYHFSRTYLILGVVRCRLA